MACPAFACNDATITQATPSSSATFKSIEGDEYNALSKYTTSLGQFQSINRVLRIALCDAEDAEKWRGYGLSTYKVAFGRAGDIVTYFHLAKNEYPSLEDVSEGKFDVIHITGSHYSAYEDLPWINNMLDLIPKYVATGCVRLVGICFGHQLLARCLGGHVDKNPSGRFVLKVEDVIFDEAALKEQGLMESFSGRAVMDHNDKQEQGVATKASTAQQQQQLQYSTDSGVNQQQSTSMLHPSQQNDHDDYLTSSTTTVQLLQSHGDQVLRLPEGAVRLASSATADVEMWTLQGRCLACQFHPEVDGSELFLEKIHPFLTANGRLSPEEAAASETSLRDITPRPRGIRLMMRAFMEGGTTTSSRREEDTLSSADTASASANSHSASATPSSSAVFNAKQVLEVGGTKEMAGELHELVTHMRASFSAGLQSGSKEWELLKNLNDVASAKCGDMADMAVALANFSDTVREKQTEAQTALDGISDLEAHVDILSKAVDKLDVQSQKLAADAGLSDGSSLTAGWGTSLLQNILGGSNSSTTNSK